MFLIAFNGCCCFFFVSHSLCMRCTFLVTNVFASSFPWFRFSGQTTLSVYVRLKMLMKQNLWLYLGLLHFGCVMLNDDSPTVSRVMDNFSDFFSYLFTQQTHNCSQLGDIELECVASKTAAFPEIFFGWIVRFQSVLETTKNRIYHIYIESRWTPTVWRRNIHLNSQ